MCKDKVNQHVVVLNLRSVSISKMLVTEFITVKNSQDLNLMWNMSIQWNQQLSRYVFSKVIECLGQNIRRQIEQSTKKVNRVQNIWIEIWKQQRKSKP